MVPLMLSGAALAEEPEEAPEIQRLQRTVEDQNLLIQDLLQRIESLEVGQETLEVQQEKQADWLAAGESSIPSWVEKVKLSGDLRVRYEHIDDDRKDDDRNRGRIRARLKASAALSDELDVAIRLSTGSEVDADGSAEGDPVSGNQTFDNAWSMKNIWVSQAYADWHPAMVEGLHVLGGKVGHPFIVPVDSELIWDSDVNPEGGVITYHREMEPVELFANAYGFYVIENSSDADPALWGAQGALKFNFETFDNSAHAMAGVSYYDFTHIEGEAPLVDGDSFGNTLVGGLYEEDFNLFNIFGEVGFKVAAFDQEFPITVFGDWVQNSEASDEDTGYSFGVKLGKAKKPGQWDIRYLYKDIEQNAVFGTFTDSDFGGGGTDAEGHEINLKYVLAKNWSLGVSYFMNDVDVEAEPEEDYERIQVDLGFKF
jgi:hypothetical protein